MVLAVSRGSPGASMFSKKSTEIPNQGQTSKRKKKLQTFQDRTVATLAIGVNAKKDYGETGLVLVMRGI